MELLLDGPKPTAEECGTEFQSLRGHSPTTGGPEFEAPDVYTGIRNTDELQMAMIDMGLGEKTPPATEQWKRIVK